MKKLGTRVSTMGSTKSDQSVDASHSVLGGDDLTMSEVGVHHFLVFEVWEVTNGCHIDLDHGKLARFVRAVSNDGDRFAGQIAKKLCA
jgi:hypothetical protein